MENTNLSNSNNNNDNNNDDNKENTPPNSSKQTDPNLETTSVPSKKVYRRRKRIRKPLEDITYLHKSSVQLTLAVEEENSEPLPSASNSSNLAANSKKRKASEQEDIDKSNPKSKSLRFDFR
ncbi:uncharacterized protein LOC126655521 [Mercurialis annua]|uniref:uncharacterized protein LOC126655521 n=1 Tax=Mercurialis annua TaxID=3986 RepID=UPI00215F3955|nr:uncharacterized protein LOC126655521 [Mercurialis annua]